LAYTGDGATVFEPFGGSGTTLIAAEKTGRKAFLIERNPIYCDMIIKRWEKFTEKKAERLKN
jgi:DNA modification methylase